MDLIEAAIFGNEEEVRRLLDEGDNPNEIFWGSHSFGGVYYGETPLCVAIKKRYIKVAELLIANGADINFAKSGGKTVLQDALGDLNIQAAKMLIEKGADTSIHELSTALWLAAREGDLEYVQLLIEKSASVNQLSTGLGRTPLHEAAKSDRLDIVQLLINNGAQVNLADYQGSTPLHEADSTKVAKILIENGALINSTDKSGRPPIQRAVFLSNLDLINFFIANGANVNNMNKDGYTPIRTAVKGGDHNIIKTLMMAGATVSPDVLGEVTEKSLRNQMVFWQQQYQSKQLYHELMLLYMSYQFFRLEDAQPLLAQFPPEIFAHILSYWIRIRGEYAALNQSHLDTIFSRLENLNISSITNSCAVNAQQSFGITQSTMGEPSTGNQSKQSNCRLNKRDLEDIQGSPPRPKRSKF